MTTVYFVRHAQPDYTVHDDASRPLTLKGRQDALLVTEFFEKIPVDCAVSSPYIRAYDTVKDCAASKGLSIHITEDFRERKVGNEWIKDFNAFAEKQWSDFDFRLEGVESLKEVQERNIKALKELVSSHRGQTIIAGGHGTAISTVINFYDSSFGYEGFNSMKDKMPWIAGLHFDENDVCTDIVTHDIVRPGT